MPNDRIFVRVPDFQYAVDYFPQIVSQLRVWARVNVPEITNEDPREPFIQGERAFALMAHYNNVLLDMVANSLYLRTATIPQSVKYILELINTKLYPAGPAEVDVLGEVPGRYNSSTRIMEAYRRFSVVRSPDQPEIVFENVSALELTHRNDSLGLAYAFAFLFNREGSNGILSSVDSSVVYDASAPFRQTDLNKYMTIEDSVIGNDADFKRIVELYDAFPSGSSNYRKARLKGASFISESPIKWRIFDVSVNHAADWNAGNPITPLSSPLSEGECLYIGHPNLQWNRMDFTVSGVITPGYRTAWEFYDPTDSTITVDDVFVDTPTSGRMRFEITSLLGPDPAQGAVIEITYIPTGAKYSGKSSVSGGVNYLDVYGYLGQSVPSTTTTDYLVNASWRPLRNLNDDTLDGFSSLVFSQKMEYDLPQTRDDSWYLSRVYEEVAGEEKVAYFLRLRIVEPLGANSFALSRVRIDQGKHYYMFKTIQGQTVEEVLGSSSGESRQQFVLRRVPYVIASGRIFVNEGGSEFEWAVVDSLVRSLSNDRHVRIDPQVDGTAIVEFGDGINGRIPPIGTNNIRAMYRIGADRDGNIGAGTLTNNRDGVGTFRTVTNPRQGRFWIEADWSSQAALERAKDRGPRVISTMRRAVSPSDASILAAAFVNVNGVRPVRRARAYEESYGPKTLELVVCGGGGAALSSDQKDEISEYFNGGNTYASYPGITVMNNKIYVNNYSPKYIALQVRVEAWSVITENLVLQAIARLLSPTAYNPVGVGFAWEFGQRVALSRIIHEVFRISPSNIFDVDVLSPALDIELALNELPILDAVNTQIVIVPPRFDS